MKGKLNGNVKWFVAMLSMAGIVGGATWTVATAVGRMDEIERTHKKDVTQLHEDIVHMSTGQSVIREEQIRQGRILERVAAKVGADPN